MTENEENIMRVLEENRQYRAIGGIELCKNAVEICRAMIERGIEPENVEAYIAFEDACVKKGFTIKGLLEAGEKQTAKNPREYEDKYYGIYYYPIEGLTQYMWVGYSF